MNLKDYKSVSDRRKAIEHKLNVDLKNIGHYSLDDSIASTRNCENMIGVAQVPIGIAGPLTVSSINVSKRQQYYIPLATTEGALVASVNRGCKAITESGGAITDSHRVGATRGLVFKVKNLRESDRFYRYLKEHFDDLQKVATQTSHHITLLKLLTRGVGRYRYVRFVFDTQDAMGMNMVTIASDALATHIERETGVTCLALAGNFDIDKKPAWLNFIENRGTKVWAEVTISKNVLENTLKTTAQKMYEVWLAKCMIGSAMAGSMAFNAQYANVIAAIFLATGQDLGHVAEGSMGITTCEVTSSSFRPTSRNPSSKNRIPSQARDDSLYISVYLPDLMVGTVGGGTGLATQKEALSMLGVAGGNNGKNAQQFAEIVAGAVLAGEISLLASLSIGTLAESHQILARGKIQNPNDKSSPKFKISI